MPSEPIKFHKILPEDVWQWKMIEKQIEQELILHDYQEIRLSVLQDYSQSKQDAQAWKELHPQNSIFHKSLKLCRADESNTQLSLRPEGTISVLHSIASSLQDAAIKRYYYHGPMFCVDHDDQPKEFYQLGVELIGSDKVLADSEVISLGLRLCKSLGLADVSIKLNNYGCAKCRKDFFLAVQEYLKQHRQDYCLKCFTALSQDPFAQTHCLDAACRKSLMGGPKISDYLCDSCQENYHRIKKIQANLAHSYHCDPYLLKNYSYYDKTVFDFVLENNGSSIVVGGGGRYDELSSMVLGKDVPAVGFYLNMDVIFEVLKRRAIHSPDKGYFSVYLCTGSEDMELMMLQIASDLHPLGVKTVLAMDTQNLEQQIMKAKQGGCSLLFSLREDNIRDGKVLMHNLAKDHQEYVALTQLTDAVLVAQKALNNQ